MNSNTLFEIFDIETEPLKDREKHDAIFKILKNRSQIRSWDHNQITETILSDINNFHNLFKQTDKIYPIPDSLNAFQEFRNTRKC